MGVLSNIGPKEVFEHFEALSMVPRRTFKNEKIGEFCMEFAQKHNLWSHQDEAGNVYIKKPGTAGYEDSEPVIMQGHMDMVATKVVGSDHDFDNDPLDLFVDGDLIGAKDTTLGGDDGFALAFTMAVLASTDIPHPPIEAVFTVDEEIGMGGAKAVDTSLLEGKMLMNLDGEAEGEFTVGCAGGVICDVSVPFVKTSVTGKSVTIKVRDLLGGHSGGDIQLQRGNAHKLMGRLLYLLSKDYKFNLVSIEGGSGANVIAQFSTAEVIVEAGKADDFAARVEELGKVFYDEFFGSEPNFNIHAEVSGEVTAEAMDDASTKNVIAFVYGTPNAVQTYDRAIEGAVESSLNGGVIVTTDNEIKVSYQVRSSVDSKLDEMMDRLQLWCDMVGGSIEVTGSYPAWAYKADSKLRPICINAYEKLSGKDAIIINSHGGLEGGILMGSKPELDIVNLGPNLTGVHTADERMSISSVARTWELIKEILKNCK